VRGVRVGCGATYTNAGETERGNTADKRGTSRHSGKQCRRDSERLAHVVFS
jgi:hypothetical protein